MRVRFLSVLFLLGCILAASTTDAYAYIGPGSGLSAIGSVVSVISAMLFAVVGFVWYPLKRLLRRGKSAMSTGSDAPSAHPGAAKE